MLINLNVRMAHNENLDNVISNQKGLSIKGRVLEQSFQIPCRVRLFEKQSGRLIADKLTDKAGLYEFDHLTKAMFFIVAHHPASQFNAVIQDNIIPE